MKYRYFQIYQYANVVSGEKKSAYLCIYKDFYQ